MKELVLYLAKSLVDHPEEVEVNEIEGDRSIILELKVSPEDMGKLLVNRAYCQSYSNSS